MNQMLKNYLKSAKERASQGIPPLPLDAEETHELTLLLENPPTNTNPPGTTPPPKTRSISEPNAPGKGTRRIFFEFFDSGFNTSFNARGAFESETHPPPTVLLLLLFLLKIKDDDDLSSASLFDDDCARCAAAAPAPPPDFPLFDAFAFEIGSRKIFMESHALHPGHWPYHWE